MSNGFFYGANKVQKSNLFYSVYTSAYLDPKYTFATRIFNDATGYKEMISNINQKFTIFLPSDDVLKKLGFSYNITRLEWVYVSPVNGAADSAANARRRLERLLYSGIVFTPNEELKNIATTSGIIRTGDDEIPGEYIKWDHNRIYAAGNESGTGARTYVNIIGSETQQNGITHYVDNVPQYSVELQGLVIARLAAANANFNDFYQYLRRSTIFNSTTGKIEGVEIGTPYTFIVPNNEAIQRAVKAGLLPPDPATTALGERDQVANFIQYHIIVNKTASNDGLITGQYETLRKNDIGDPTYVGISSTAGTPSMPGTLSFKDETPGASIGGNPAANFIPASSNNLADRSLIHLVDNYLTLLKP